jgi:single-stranded DNA-specific DHH superfamily exonuclease
MNPQTTPLDPSPSVADVMDTIRDNARNLSDAIKLANKMGINVSLEQANYQDAGDDTCLLKIVYRF